MSTKEKKEFKKISFKKKLLVTPFRAWVTFYSERPTSGQGIVDALKTVLNVQTLL